MADSDFAQVLRSFKSLKLDSVDDQDCSQLGEIFDACTRLMNVIDTTDVPSHKEAIQESLKAIIEALKQCTRMVNELGLFSSNETSEELQTSSIKYLLLPALLGSLLLQIKTEDVSQRLNNIETADIYFKDFLLRCTNYELCGTRSDHLKDIFDSEEGAERGTQTLDQNQVREKKIQQYKRKKELEDREKVLKPALERPESEEYIREYYLVLLERWIITAEEELENSKREKEILKFMSKKDGKLGNITKEKKLPVKPLQPIIITKNEVQKQVFGLGYPSIPVLTIDDFYRQRFEKQIEEQKQNKLEQQRQQKKGKSLQEAALSGEGGLSKEDEEIEKERLTETDDPRALAKARNWDAWKDENPRGAGNRYNKG